MHTRISASVLKHRYIRAQNATIKKMHLTPLPVHKMLVGVPAAGGLLCADCHHKCKRNQHNRRVLSHRRRRQKLAFSWTSWMPTFLPRGMTRCWLASKCMALSSLLWSMSFTDFACGLTRGIKFPSQRMWWQCYRRQTRPLPPSWVI